ncbi:DNA-helicase RecG [Sesbania bispinosa]|nr:DNA-helicase RecG [Sesbania bispinosa]
MLNYATFINNVSWLKLYKHRGKLTKYRVEKAYKNLRYNGGLAKGFETKINASRDDENQRILKKEKRIGVIERVAKVPDISVMIIESILAYQR